jgi:hypothetical protein
MGEGHSIRQTRPLVAHESLGHQEPPVRPAEAEGRPAPILMRLGRGAPRRHAFANGKRVDEGLAWNIAFAFGAKLKSD